MNVGNIFYKIRHNTAYMEQFPWAVSIHPKSEMVYKACPEYGVVVRYPSGAFDVTLEDGEAYPDCLGCGAYPLFIVSERVTELFDRVLPPHSYLRYEVGIKEIVDAPKLEQLTPPKYYRIEVQGTCEVDLEAMGVEIVRYIPECQHLVTKPMSLPRPFILKSNSWNGNPLFRDWNLFPRVIFCTSQIKELIQKERLTNFRFVAVKSGVQLS